MKFTELIYHLLHVALGILRDNGGSMRLSELIRAVEEREGGKIGERDRQKDVFGDIRWTKNFRWHSIGFAKAGLLKKKSGVWYLTPEGEAASRRQVKQVAAEVKKVRAAQWGKKGRGQKPTGGARTPSKSRAREENDEASEDILLDAFEDQARNGIVEQIRKMGPGDLEQLVAALLRGMGYHTPVVASGGPDGGVDVLAYRDPLGAASPRLKVQVKHRTQSAKQSPENELQSLNGLLTEGEIGVFVATAGFTSNARKFVRTTSKHLEMIDMDRLIDLWREHYDALADEDKALLPLRRIAFLDRERIAST